MDDVGCLGWVIVFDSPVTGGVLERPDGTEEKLHRRCPLCRSITDRQLRGQPDSQGTRARGPLLKGSRIDEPLRGGVGMRARSARLGALRLCRPHLRLDAVELIAELLRPRLHTDDANILPSRDAIGVTAIVPLRR